MLSFDMDYDAMDGQEDDGIGVHQHDEGTIELFPFIHKAIIGIFLINMLGLSMTRSTRTKCQYQQVQDSLHFVDHGSYDIDGNIGIFIVYHIWKPPHSGSLSCKSIADRYRGNIREKRIERPFLVATGKNENVSPNQVLTKFLVLNNKKRCESQSDGTICSSLCQSSMMKIHKILDADADQECIDSFDDGSVVNIETIKVGTQIYYLYKDEDDSTNLQWYWGMLYLILCAYMSRCLHAVAH